METALILRGRLSDSRHIELEEPISGLDGEVEVMVRRIPKPERPAAMDVFDFIANLSPGTRSKEDIDQQMAEERGSWGDR